MNSNSKFKNASQEILNTSSEEDLRDFAWGLHIIMHDKEKEEKMAYIQMLFDRLLTLSEYAKCEIMDNMINLIDDMTSQYQCNFIIMLINLNNCTCCTYCCKNSINILMTLSRLYHRVSGSAKLLIQGYVDGFIPCNDEMIALEEVKRIIDDNTTLTTLMPYSRVTSRNSKKTVALIIPDFLSATSFLQPPIDMLMAAAQLRENEYGVVLIDNRTYHFNSNKIIEEIADVDYVVITTTPYDHIQNYFLDYRLKLSLKLIDEIVDSNFSRPVIVCGAHGTVRPDIIFRDTKAQIILKWDYDYHILNVINALETGTPLSLIQNVVERDTQLYEGNINRNFTRENLDDNVLPAYDMIDINNYFSDVYMNNQLFKKWKSGVILASRGCKHNCTFCFNFWGKDIMYRSVDSVLNEMVYLSNSIGINDIFFIDFHFTQNKQWVSEFCKELVKRKITMSWSAQVRCDSVNLELLEQMANANCRSLWFGVESFDPCIVRNAQKYTNIEVITDALNNCKSVGILPHQFIMLGLPGENTYTIQRTITHVKEMKMPYTESILIATPRFGTAYYELAKKQFPELGDDFYSLTSVKGLVNNDLFPTDIQDAVSVFRDRDFIYRK